MKANKPLWLYRELMGRMLSISQRYYEEEEECARLNIETSPFKLQASLAGIDRLPRSTVFDCRQLPFEFLMDTAEATLGEQEEKREAINLPYDYCYFEVAEQFGFVAYAADLLGDDNEPLENPDFAALGQLARPIGITGFFKPWPEGTGFFYSEETKDDVSVFTVALLNDTRPDKFIEVLEGDKGHGMGAALMLVGILSLLSDKLIASQFVPDPAPKLTKARAKRGKLPVTGPTHVLTIDVAAVRNAVSRSGRLLQHESPCLHWRRGHSRVVHRGSEFELKTWVRRCLVGDPAKGFAGKSYRLVDHPPMVEPTKLEA